MRLYKNLRNELQKVQINWQIVAAAEIVVIGLMAGLLQSRFFSTANSDSQNNLQDTPLVMVPTINPADQEDESKPNANGLTIRKATNSKLTKVYLSEKQIDTFESNYGYLGENFVSWGADPTNRYIAYGRLDEQSLWGGTDLYKIVVRDMNAQRVIPIEFDYAKIAGDKDALSNMNYSFTWHPTEPVLFVSTTALTFGRYWPQQLFIFRLDENAQKMKLVKEVKLDGAIFINPVEARDPLEYKFDENNNLMAEVVTKIGFRDGSEAIYTIESHNVTVDVDGNVKEGQRVQNPIKRVEAYDIEQLLKMDRQKRLEDDN